MQTVAVFIPRRPPITVTADDCRCVPANNNKSKGIEQPRERNSTGKKTPSSHNQTAVAANTQSEERPFQRLKSSATCSEDSHTHAKEL